MKLVLEYKVDYRLKNTQRYVFLQIAWNVLMRMHRRIKRNKNRILLFFVYWGRAVLIATGAKSLDAKCEFYGFNDDLIEIIN